MSLEWVDSPHRRSFPPAYAAGSPLARRTPYMWRGSDAARLTCIDRHGASKRSRPKAIAFMQFHYLPISLCVEFTATSLHTARPVPAGGYSVRTQLSLTRTTCHFVNRWPESMLPDSRKLVVPQTGLAVILD